MSNLSLYESATCSFRSKISFSACFSILTRFAGSDSVNKSASFCALITSILACFTLSSAAAIDFASPTCCAFDSAISASNSAISAITTDLSRSSIIAASTASGSNDIRLTSANFTYSSLVLRRNACNAANFSFVRSISLFSFPLDLVDSVVAAVSSITCTFKSSVSFDSSFLPSFNSTIS